MNLAGLHRPRTSQQLPTNTTRSTSEAVIASSASLADYERGAEGMMVWEAVVV